MITSFLHGHKIIFKEGKWRYEDGQVADQIRPCPRCNQMPTKENHDACIANLPGVKNACCGHGVEPGYVEFEDGRKIENLTDFYDDDNNNPC